MRANRLLAAAALVLAGCGSGEKAAGVAVNAADPAPGASAGPQASAAPEPKGTVEEEAIPAAFHGVYDSSRAACGRPSDGRLAVSARELRFHESIGSVRSVTAESAGRIRVEADYQGEGEKWRNSHELRLSGDGSRLTISGDGTSFERDRCPEGGL
ncbi:MAG TPA: hypothetical protein VF782_12065 [Allosphingosinicella sp.]|jgi:hypothetical protein